MAENKETSGTVSSHADEKRSPVDSGDPDQIRAEIEETRAELGETVEALAAKVDVKAQLEEKKEQFKGRLQEKQDEARATAAEVKEKLFHVTAHDVKNAVRQVPARVQQRRKPVLISLGVLAAWMLRRRRKRRRDG